MTHEQLQHIMESREHEHLEFKETKSSFEFEELVHYSVALANEGGGRMVLGVTDKQPRKVVGSQAFQDLERTKLELMERLHLRIDAEALQLPEGRVVVFQVPPRPIGMPIHYKGAYWMRSGESLVPMTPDQLKRIFEESGPDYSAEIAKNATFADLDPVAITRFREMWKGKSGNSALQSVTDVQLLTDAELLVESAVTYGHRGTHSLRLRESAGPSPHTSRSRVRISVKRGVRPVSIAEGIQGRGSSCSTMNCGRPSTFGTRFSIIKKGSLSGISRPLTKRSFEKPFSMP